MALARRRWWELLALWLLLATALGHGLIPIGSPLAKHSGSAFSAATFEVALSASRPDARADRLAPKRTDPSDPPDLLADLSEIAASAAPRAAQPRGRIAGGLRWPGTARTAHRPRAPPLA